MNDDAQVAEVFRTEWPRLVATLVRDLGDLGVAEDVAQDAFVEATTRWPIDGRPDRPGAWLLTTARRKAIDRVRRTNRFGERLPQLAHIATTEHDRQERNELDRREGQRALQGAGQGAGQGDGRHALIDDQLALLVGCCHPALAPDAQVALTLRAVAGLSTAQIARAFFVSESTMTRRLTRSKDKIRTAGIPFDPPDLSVLEDRLPAICSVISSIFTEGHTSATEATLVRGDLCDEAIWLGELLASLVPNSPEVAGLLALMLLIDARRTTRVDDGATVLLADQDRSKWNQETIARGLAELARAHSFGSGGPFQFQAAIAALHATAPSFAETDWAGIVRLYDVLLRRDPRALVALNRAVAVAQLHGPATALDALDAIADADDLDGDIDQYVYFHSARAEMLADLGRQDESRAAFQRAIELSGNVTEQHHLEQRALRQQPHDTGG